MFNLCGTVRLFWRGYSILHSHSVREVQLLWVLACMWYWLHFLPSHPSGCDRVHCLAFSLLFPNGQ